MANYGNDPTEVAVPWHVFKSSGFDVSFATETGTAPACDKKMYEGMTQKLLGATKDAVQTHATLQSDSAYTSPLSWTAPEFDLTKYDLVFMPGGHEKGMRQYIESQSLHRQLARYVPLVSRKNNSRKCLGAICHGVQVLAAADKEGKDESVIFDFETTALPGTMEQGIFQATRLFLGDYYKTYGPASDSVEQIVRKRLNNSEKQYKNSLGMAP